MASAIVCFTFSSSGLTTMASPGTIISPVLSDWPRNPPGSVSPSTSRTVTTAVPPTARIGLSDGR